MPLPTATEDLIALIKSLGARSPEDWVQYLPADPSTQLARYMFLKQAWDSVAVEGDTNWMDAAIERAAKYPDEPYAGMGKTMHSMLSAGVSREEITELARCLQAGMLFRLAYLLDGRAYPVNGLENIDWGLFRTDKDGNPTQERIAGVHESVLETDPTGREMRPSDA